MHFDFCSHLLVFEDYIPNSILLVCPIFLFSSLFCLIVLSGNIGSLQFWFHPLNFRYTSVFLNDLRLEISLCYSLSHPNTAIVYHSIVSYRPELIKHSHREKVLKDLSKNGHFTEYSKISKLQLTDN